MAKTRTEIFIETSETLIIKTNRTFLRHWCEECEQEVSMLPVREAALFSGYGWNEIRSLMEDRHIHFRYLQSETAFICLRSLFLV